MTIQSLDEKKITVSFSTIFHFEEDVPFWAIQGATIISRSLFRNYYKIHFKISFAVSFRFCSQLIDY